MPIKHDIRPQVEKLSELPFERLRVVQDISELRIADTRLAIVFIFAEWSGPSVTALRRFTHLLATLDLGSLDVIILDNDCMSGEETACLFGNVFHGYGEMLWIRDGRVVAELPGFQPESEALILSHTRELL
jgi:hypothetical protein